MKSALLSAVFSLPLVKATTTWRQQLKHAVFFGDSFTDQSRSHSIDNGTYPGKYYETVWPPEDPAAYGRVSWPWYFGHYTGLTYENYAVGGAVCNNDLTPRFDLPAVSGGQLAWFVQDHVVANQTDYRPPKLDIPGAETLAIIFIGTNDLGLHFFLGPESNKGSPVWPNVPPYIPANPPVAPGVDNATTILDMVECQIKSVWRLHDLGVRSFLLFGTAPLHLAPLYSTVGEPTIYWPEPHDGQSWHRQIFQYSNAFNTFLQFKIQEAQRVMAQKGGKIEFFDTYKFFENLYLDPDRYYNGSLPSNVKGHCHVCPDPTDYHSCGIGDCQPEERDSFMWWDELHPSEQTGRLLAQEVVRKLDGHSPY